MWNNSAAKIILSGLADQATAEVTSLLGEEDHQRLGSQVDQGGSRRSVSAQTMTRRLVSEDSLRRQPLGQGMLIYRDLPPMRLALRPFYKDRRLRALTKTEPTPPDGAVVDGESGPAAVAATDDLAGAA